MKLLIGLLLSMSLTPLLHADNSALSQISLSEYQGAVQAPERLEAAFPEDAQQRDGTSLHGATFNWTRDQRAAWGGGIPGLTTSEAKAGCGPIAAEGMVRFFKKDPNLDMIAEVFRVAKSKGYWNGAMQGPGSEQKLLADLGIQVSEPIWNGTEQQIRESLDKGKPVIISTQRHYFFVGGYNNNGQLFVGYTGQTMKCGAAQMTLSAISQCGGGSLALLIPQ